MKYWGGSKQAHVLIYSNRAVNALTGHSALESMPTHLAMPLLVAINTSTLYVDVCYCHSMEGNNTVFHRFCIGPSLPACVCGTTDSCEVSVYGTYCT